MHEARAEKTEDTCIILAGNARKMSNLKTKRKKKKS
jgi:hypothetical protein